MADILSRPQCVKSIPLVLLFFRLSKPLKLCLPIEYHIHIWQTPPQLSCYDDFQIWMRFYSGNLYFSKPKLSIMQKLANQYLVSPTAGPENKDNIFVLFFSLLPWIKDLCEAWALSLIMIDSLPTVLHFLVNYFVTVSLKPIKSYLGNLLVNLITAVRFTG